MCLPSVPYQVADCLGLGLPQFPFLSVGMCIPPYKADVETVKEGESLGNLCDPLTAQCPVDFSCLRVQERDADPPPAPLLCFGLVIGDRQT